MNFFINNILSFHTSQLSFFYHFHFSTWIFSYIKTQIVESWILCLPSSIWAWVKEVLVADLSCGLVAPINRHFKGIQAHICSIYLFIIIFWINRSSHILVDGIKLKLPPSALTYSDGYNKH